MTYLQGMVLGLIQGLTEFLPVSSSGHLLMTRNLMGLGDVPVLFDILLHGATLVVVIFMFRKKISQLLLSLFRWMGRKARDDDRGNLKLVALIIVSVFITGIIGLGLSNLDVSQTPKIVFPLYLATAIILWFTRKAAGGRRYRDIGISDALLVGLAQGIGVLPGISRSGITISSALYRKMDRDVAAEYSFLISIPAICAAILLDLKDAGTLMESISLPVLSAAFLTTLVSGFLALWLLVKLINSGKFYIFSFYLLALGILGLLFF